MPTWLKIALAAIVIVGVFVIAPAVWIVGAFVACIVYVFLVEST